MVDAAMLNFSSSSIAYAERCSRMMSYVNNKFGYRISAIPEIMACLDIYGSCSSYLPEHNTETVGRR